MNSHWFKFYGQDWLTDLKIIKMPVVDRLCFITLLCLASCTESGIIKQCDEKSLIELTHLYDNPYDDEDNDYRRAQGCLARYESNGLVTQASNGDVTVVNFIKRQGSNLTNAERQERYRNRQDKPKEQRNKSNDEHVTKVTLDKIREDKIREDKIRLNNKSLVLEKCEPIDFQLSELLLERIKANLPTYKSPSSLDGWANCCRLMREQDKRNPEHIRAVIYFCQQDSFWKSNILSMDKLRKQFDQLTAKAQQTIANQPISI